MRKFLFVVLVCGIIIVLIYPQTGWGKAYDIVVRNPIKAESISELLQSITNWILGIAGSVMLVVLIFAGFRYMTAGANEEKAGQAKKMLKWSVIGIAITIGAAAIVNSAIAALGGKTT